MCSGLGFSGSGLLLLGLRILDLPLVCRSIRRGGKGREGRERGGKGREGRERGGREGRGEGEGREGREGRGEREREGGSRGRGQRKERGDGGEGGGEEGYDLKPPLKAKGQHKVLHTLSSKKTQQLINGQLATVLYSSGTPEYINNLPLRAFWTAELLGTVERGKK